MPGVFQCCARYLSNGIPPGNSFALDCDRIHDLNHGLDPKLEYSERCTDTMDLIWFIRLHNSIPAELTDPYEKLLEVEAFRHLPLREKS
tara:strand:- start:259 stop:525 length:267 start_codon:yes stop_codon:yes gene_type:complete